MLERVKERCSMIKNRCKKVVCFALAASVSAVMSLPVLAAEGGSTTIGYGDFSSIIDTIKNQVSVTTIVGVIGSVTAVCIGLVFFWWAFRKVVRMIMSAFRGGKYTG